MGKMESKASSSVRVPTLDSVSLAELSYPDLPEAAKDKGAASTLTVPYNEVGMISPESGKIIATHGLNPCVAVLLAGIRNDDGGTVAVLCHIPAPPSAEYYPDARAEHLKHVRQMLSEGQRWLEEQGVNPARLSAVVSGKEEFRGVGWDDMSASQKNASNIIDALKAAGIDSPREHYTPQAEFRTFEYDNSDGSYSIIAERERDGVPSPNPKDILFKGRLTQAATDAE